MRVAAEIAERKNEKNVKISHLDEAEDKIERDRIFDTIMSLPKQSQAVLYAVMSFQNNDEYVFTGDVYSIYKNICAKTGLKPLTQRRLSDIIGELDMFGIINAKVISKGRYGRTKKISVPMAEQIKEKIKKSLETAMEI